MRVWELEAVLAFVFFFMLVPLLWAPWLHRIYRDYGRFAGMPALLSAGAVLYGCALVAFTFFPLPSFSEEFCRTRADSGFLRLNPGDTLDDLVAAFQDAGLGFLAGGVFLQVFFNVLLFVPLGFLVSYRLHRGVAVALGVGFAVSLTIEVVQGTGLFGILPCPYRLADTADLITNTVGAGLGWLVGVAVRRVLPFREPQPSLDLAPPTRRRRAAAFGTDLLVVVLLGILLQIPLNAVAVVVGWDDVTARSWFAVAQWTLGTALPVVAVTLILPLVRSDRATAGYWTVMLALAQAGGGAADRGRVATRFAIRWLPVLWVGLGWPFAVLSAAIWTTELGATLIRSDRRSLSGVLAGTTTITLRRLRRARVTRDGQEEQATPFGTAST